MNLKTSEPKMTVPGLFLGNIVLLECISAVDFIVLFTLWVFTVNVLFVEKRVLDLH